MTGALAFAEAACHLEQAGKLIREQSRQVVNSPRTGDLARLADAICAQARALSIVAELYRASAEIGPRIPQSGASA
jgi:hypothetical protein